jgi:hypothetical protein
MSLLLTTVATLGVLTTPALAAPEVPQPPPLPAAAQAGGRYWYSNGGDAREIDAAEIARLVAANPAGTHLVWQQGWAAWKPAAEVPEIARLGDDRWSYADADGKVVQLTAAEVAAKVAAAPNARHLVWHEGMAGWSEARDVPRIAGLVQNTSGGALPAPGAPANGPQALPPKPPPAPASAAGPMTLPPAAPSPGAVTLAPSAPPVPTAPMGGAPPAGAPSVATNAPPPLPPKSAPGANNPPPAPGAGTPPPGAVATAAPPPGAPPGPPPPGSPGAGNEPPYGMPPGAMGPGMPPGPPPNGAPPPGRPGVDVGAEVRINFAAENLESLGEDGSPVASFVISRLRPRFGVQLNDHLRGVALVEIHQDGAVDDYTVGSTTIEIPRYASGWSIQGREIYAEATFGEKIRHRIRWGIQKPAFGVRDRFDSPDNYYLGGSSAYKDVERRAGVILEEDGGLGYRVAGANDRWSADLQVLNGAGTSALDDNNGKDIVVRGSGSPVKWATIEASVLRGSRGENTDEKLLAMSVDGEVRGPHQRLLGELVLGRTEEGGEREFNGGMVAGAWDFPLPKAKVLDHLTLVGRYMGFDPVSGTDYPDAWWAAAGAAMLYWNTHPGQTLSTGLTWETYIPQNSELPINHSLVAQVAFKF